MRQKPVAYDEALRVPLRWWALATMLLASFLLAFLVALPAVVAVSAVGVLTFLVVAVFLGYGSAHVSVRDATFSAGRACIPVTLLGEPTVLDARATRQMAGVEADARAFLLLRPYLKRSVRVLVEDPDDPAPYWLVSTRRPDRLVAALSAAMAEQARG